MALFHKKKNTSAEPEDRSEKKGSIRLQVLRPKTFTDALNVADALIAGYTAVINLEEMEATEKRALLHFINGVIYALDGGIKSLNGDTTYIVTPGNISLSEAEAEITSSETQADGRKTSDNPFAGLFSGKK